MNETNPNKQTRNIIVPVSGKEYSFAFSRNDISQIADVTDGTDKLAFVRSLLLRAVKPEQRESFAKVLNADGNMTIEGEIFGKIAPFLSKNKDIIGEPQVVN